MKTLFALLMSASCLLACKANESSPDLVEPPVAMDPIVKQFVVTSASLEITNSSIAPGHRVDVRYSLDGGRVEGFSSIIDKLMDETMVNNEITLREYVALKQSGDSDRLTALRKKTPERGPQPKGGKDYTLSVSGADGASFTFDDSVDYSGELVHKLHSLVVDKGLQSRMEPDRKPERSRPEPVLEPIVLEPPSE